MMFKTEHVQTPGNPFFTKQNVRASRLTVLIQRLFLQPTSPRPTPTPQFQCCNIRSARPHVSDPRLPTTLKLGERVIGERGWVCECLQTSVDNDDENGDTDVDHNDHRDDKNDDDETTTTAAATTTTKTATNTTNTTQRRRQQWRIRRRHASRTSLESLSYCVHKYIDR